MGSSGSGTVASSAGASERSSSMTASEPLPTTSSGRKDIATRFSSGTQHPRWRGSSAPATAGDRFGWWELLDPSFDRTAKERRVLCRCTACGAEKLVDWRNLRLGRTKGCLCRSRLTTDPYPEPWQRRVGRRMTAARNRCRNPNNPGWKHYGGRGITFDFQSTREAVNWVITNLGAPASPDLELDRVDNDQGYRPGNLRWATRSEQTLNSRRWRSTTF